MSEIQEAPETVVLLTQKHIYALKDKRTALAQAVDDAKNILRSAESDVEYNEKCITECAQFLQEQCPNAVGGTWFEEME